MNFTNTFSEEVWSVTHRYAGEKSITDTFQRVANAIAAPEGNSSYWANHFFSMFDSGFFCPAGRILANAGTTYDCTLFNCYTSPIPKYDPDSIEGIVETLLVQMLTLKSEGGWGHNFSWLRPRGSFIHGIGVESPGACKYIELFNRSSDIITAGSGKENKDKSLNKKKKGRIRKGAQLAILFDCHPDVEEFIAAKRVPNRFDKFNVSVGSSNEFMDKVCRVDETGVDESWDLIFPDTQHEKYKTEWDGDIYLWHDKGYPVIIYKSISIKYLWDLIMRSTYDFNDPGQLWIDIANRTYLANYLLKILSANPCGEQTMPPASVCDLGSLVLPSFVIPHSYGKGWMQRILWTELENAARLAVRFLDNVNDVSKTPHAEYTKSAKEMRRIGLGVMGWGSLLYLLRTRFGSDEAEKVKNKLMECIVYSAVDTSAELAKEKGMFVGCDPEKVADNVFWDQIDLPKEIRDKIRQYGLRNSALFSIQPNGNTSIVMNILSGGCEPVFMHEYIRTVIVQTPPLDILNKCPKYYQGEFNETDLFKLTKEGNENVLRGEIGGIVYKIDKNRGLTREVLCEDYAVQQMKKDGMWDANADWAVTTDTLTVEDHVKDLAGWARWIDAAISKTINIPNDYPYEKFKQVYIDAYKTGVIKGITTYRAGTMCNVLAPVDKKVDKGFKKRPRELLSDLYHVNVKNKPHTIIVSLMDNKPYELLIVGDSIKKGISTGKVIKQKKGHYNLYDTDGNLLFDNITESCTSEEANISRFVSMCLRHQIGPDYIFDQLSKFSGDINSMAKSISRCLKKYIKDDTPTGVNCPECGKGLIFLEGCQTCSGKGGCGWSKC